MDKIDTDSTTPGAPLDIAEDFDFEVEDVKDLDIFAPQIVACSSTTSSSSCCA